MTAESHPVAIVGPGAARPVPHEPGAGPTVREATKADAPAIHKLILDNLEAGGNGNFQGWVAAGGKVEKGPIFSTEIKWVRKLGKGEVSVADFRKAVLGETTDTFVIDARTKDEIAEYGIFKNTVNIPLDEIAKRLNEIPKDKKIYVHCSTGARADLAYRELVKNGYDVKFLLLDITDPECDCPIIKP